MSNFKVVYYEKPDGILPVEEFILSQSLRMQAKIFRMLELLELKGNDLREPYSSHLGDGIFEVRAKSGSDITRVLYFFVADRKVILTNGFVKKTRRTPKREIALARKYRSDYLARYKEEHYYG